MSHKFKIGEPVRYKNRHYRVIARLPETGRVPRYRITNEDAADDERIAVEGDLRNPGGSDRLRAPKGRTAAV